MDSCLLSLENVYKAYAGETVVRDVNFRVGPGEIVGFLGPNGAGKTTTMRMALGLVKPDSGCVRLFGRPPGASAFGRIGFLPEERGLYKKQRVRDSIAFMARLNGVERRAAYRKADELLERYGLESVRKKKNRELSKGMAQKVQLLGAIAHEPEFYILDEPFSGLDPVNQQMLEQMVREIAKQGRTIIFSTHVMEHAQRLCQRIILLSKGQIIFDDLMERALDSAPRHVVLASDDERLHAQVHALARKVERRENTMTLDIYLKTGVSSQTLLEQLVAEKIKLTRFEPKAISLHDAFVEKIGLDLCPPHDSQNQL